MSCISQHSRVHPNDIHSVSEITVGSSRSMTESQFNVAIHDLVHLDAAKNAFEEFFKGNPKSFYGKTKQLFKILFIIMIPVTLLTCLITNTFCVTFTNYHDFSNIRNTLLYSVKLGRVIHYLQEERDVSALYLISSEKEVKTLLLMSYTETDMSLEELTTWTAGPTSIRKEFKSKEKFLSYLNKHRYELDTLKQTVVEELQMYTTLIRVFIKWLYDAVTEDQSGSIWRSLVAYQEVVAAKEYKGLERALGTIYYAAGQFSSIDVYLWFLESQDVANATFFSARQYSDLVLDLYRNFNEEELRYGIVTHMSSDIKRNYSAGNNNNNNNNNLQTAQWWFDNKTVFMDLLLETQSELADEITQMLDTLQINNVNQMWTTSVVFFCVFTITVVIIYVVFSLNDEIQKYLWTLSQR
ncbi:uncharacterized protein LOC121375386 [Gigantopelta aegis]|uniref:uncharacterized protein LOC121375386 n=1 Tax=Gigantopelta aegis TaxID=1735272 RepID=UPI001B88C082|nr:uncharacterized protein LOC121375386 [Gigantopelta aegis]